MQQAASGVSLTLQEQAELWWPHLWSRTRPRIEALHSSALIWAREVRMEWEEGGASFIYIYLFHTGKWCLVGADFKTAHQKPAFHLNKHRQQTTAGTRKGIVKSTKITGKYQNADAISRGESTERVITWKYCTVLIKANIVATKMKMINNAVITRI